MLSHPIRLNWAGWESTTQRLYSAGWELSVQQDLYRSTMYVLFRHPQFGIQGGSEVLENIPFSMMMAAHKDWAAQDRHAQWARDQILRVYTLGKNVRVQTEREREFDFLPIDGMPQFCEVGSVDLDSIAHFAPHAGKEIYLPDLEVGELLDKILAKQLPVQQALAMERTRRRVAAKIIGVA